MPLILAIESSTRNCSVSLFEGQDQITLLEEQSDQFIHSEKLHVFLEQIMKKAAYSFNQLDAVAVTKGPGSYTGLRIGVSAAKGLCYSLKIPLIAIDSLSVYVQGFLSGFDIKEDQVVIPFLDARRMEVYQSVFDSKGQRQTEIQPLILEADSFEQVEASKIHLIGDGAEKAKTMLKSDRFVFHDYPFPSSAALAELGAVEFAAKNFEDVAYFEPLYIKSFVAGKPKKLL